MTRARLITALVLLAAMTMSPAGAWGADQTGIIPLRLTDAETSYLGVVLKDPTDRSVRNARLPITNDGSNDLTWGSSISLQVFSTRLVGTSIEARVSPVRFSLIGTEPWIDDDESFKYYVRLADSSEIGPAGSGTVQRQSSLYFTQGLQGEPLFAGTLYVEAVLHKIDLKTGATSNQPLHLELNTHGKWVDEPGVSQLDLGLSSLLPFTELNVAGQLKGSYTCVNELHPDGYYCLEISPTLLLALGGQ